MSAKTHHLAAPDTPFDPEGRDPDPATSSALYRDHASWLVAFLRRRFGAQEAEDLAQDVFVRASRNGVTLRNPKAFLAKVAQRVVQDAARRKAARPDLVPATDDLPRHGEAPDQAEALLLKQVILQLPPRLQEVFLLSRFGGLTYEEIARRCNLSVKTVEARMTQALAICAKRLRD